MLYDDKKFIGSVIKNARKNAKLSQAQLSEMIDMCDKNLGNIENGKQFPTVNNFLKMIEVLNLSLADFGVITEEKKSSPKNKLIELALRSSEERCGIYLNILKAVKEYIKIN